MILLVKLISIIIIFYGCLTIFRPTALKKMFEYLKKGNRVYFMAAIKVIIGILMVIASKRCSTPWIILFFGALSVFGGAISFVLKKGVIIKLIEWGERYLKKNAYLSGIGVLIIGVLLALAA